MEDLSLNMWCMIYPCFCLPPQIQNASCEIWFSVYGFWLTFALTSKSVIFKWPLGPSRTLVVNLKAQTDGCRSWVSVMRWWIQHFVCVHRGDEEPDWLTDCQRQCSRTFVFFLWVFSGHCSSVCWEFLAALLVLLSRYLLFTVTRLKCQLFFLLSATHLASFTACYLVSVISDHTIIRSRNIGIGSSPQSRRRH